MVYITNVGPVKIRVTKMPRRDGFAVRLWVVGFSTSYINLKNRVFVNDEEFDIALSDYVEHLNNTSKKFRDKFNR